MPEQKPQKFAPSLPDKEQIKLIVDDPNQSGIKMQIENFTEYSFSSNFLQPTDGWSFTVGAEELSEDETAVLKPGASVQLIVNDTIISSGYIDAITCQAQRGSGLEYVIDGRDRLSQAVDACANPTKKLKEGQTLANALKEIFAPYGWDSEDKLIEDAAADLDVRTNKFRAKTKTSEGKGFGRRAIKQALKHADRPYYNEGVFQFAIRLAHRFGLHIWTSPDGEVLYVSTPDFAQAPSYRLARNRLGDTNVLAGSVKFSLLDQPTHIVADGHSGTGEFGKSPLICIMANVAVETPEALELLPYIKAGAKVLGSHTIPASSSMNPPRIRVSYLHDDESKTIEQLEAFVRREMALLQRKSLEARYDVEGHGQMVDGQFVPWFMNRVVHVKDEPAGLEEDLWILGVHYKKSRGAGTTTGLDLIRLNTLVFSDDQKKR